MTDYRRLSVFLAIGLVVAGILCFYQPNTVPNKIAEWNRSADIGTPENKPIAAMWIEDGQPCVYFVERIGPSYYEYNPQPFAPFALLYTYPPIYWSEMPGAAK